MSGLGLYPAGRKGNNPPVMKNWTAVALVFWSGCAAAFAGAEDLKLWYREPISNSPDSYMNEALPIGNGRLGGLVTGWVEQETVVLNEDSLWTGDENPGGDYGKMGAYQTMGNLVVHMEGVEKSSEYRRELDLENALVRIGYESGGAHFSREYFCSHPGGVLVARFVSDKPGRFTGSIELKDSHRASSTAEKNRITFAGALSNGMKYEAQVLVLHEGGTLQAGNGTLEFKQCDSLTFIVSAGTDYIMDPAKNFTGDDPHARVTQLADAAAKKSYAALKAAHEKDFHALFDRVSLDLSDSTHEQMALPTDERKLKAADQADPGMEALLFQYGRYLMIACSRPGGLPANLQGLWNDRNDPPWSSDYHANINIEMNYWPAEVANLSECHQPFFDLVASQLPAWRKAAAASPDLKTPDGSMTSRGWALRTSHNTRGGMGWNWDKTANAWYCRHFWEHYAFTGDKDFLRRTAYPLMKETCEFWEDHLKTLDDGRLVVPSGWSPEHGPVEDGVSYNQEIVWDLFNNYINAAVALGVDKDYCDKIAVKRYELAAPGIGSWGQLLEWMTEKHDPRSPELDTRNDHHRHTSHLFALYPGAQISPEKTPGLAKAAQVSLDARGDTGDVREWSFAWRTALYARLLDGGAAHRELQQMFSSRNTCPNLFGLHPPMQIDGNFGITAAMCEMLVQSQDDSIRLLPALPKEWLDGSVKGLCARGGFVVDVAWSKGIFLEAAIHGAPGQKATVTLGDESIHVKIPPGGVVQLNGRFAVVTHE